MPGSGPNRRYEFLRVRDFLLLDAIAEHGSLRQVAAAMHVTQPALTQVLKTLEDVFGTRLVDRLPHGLVLTAEGQAALTRLRSAHGEILGALQAVRAKAVAPVRLGVLPSTGATVLPDLLLALRTRRPDLPVVVTEAAAPVLWAQVQSGALDAVLTRYPMPTADQGHADGLVHGVVARTHFALYAPADLAIDPQDWATLQRLPWLMPSEPSWIRQRWAAHFADAGLGAPVPAVVSDAMHTNLGLAARCRLLTVLPVRHDAAPAAAGLRQVASPWPDAAIPIVLAHRRLSEAVPAVTDVVEAARTLETAGGPC
jgi:DNA-binding transcriptional LysR family regulator